MVGRCAKEASVLLAEDLGFEPPSPSEHICRPPPLVPGSAWAHALLRLWRGSLMETIPGATLAETTAVVSHLLLRGMRARRSTTAGWAKAPLTAEIVVPSEYEVRELVHLCRKMALLGIDDDDLPLWGEPHLGPPHWTSPFLHVRARRSPDEDVHESFDDISAEWSPAGATVCIGEHQLGDPPVDVVLAGS